MKPLINKHFQRFFWGAVAPLALALHTPLAKAIAPNTQDPIGVGGSPTFVNPHAGWAYSVFGLGTSIYPFTPFTDPACTGGTGGTCEDLDYVYDQTKVIWAANVSIDLDSTKINPVTTVDQGGLFPVINEPFSIGYLKNGAPSDGGWVLGYVFGGDITTDPNGLYGGGKVNYLGFFNPTGSDFRAPHEISLWELYTGSDPILNPPVKLATVNIGIGSVASECDQYKDLFCWVKLASPVTLQDGLFYTVGAYGGYSPGTPTPLPLMGAVAALGISRKLRQRIRVSA